MKKALIIILGIAVVGIAAFAYVTRPVAAPTENISEQTTDSQLNAPVTEVSGESQQSATLYRINPTYSKVSFSIDEELRGKPFTAIGTTNQVSGDVIYSEDPADKPTITVGKITIDARTFKTDSSQRDGAINRLIINSEKNPYVTFTPSAVSGLPEKVVDGTPFTFTVSGTITLAGITKPATLSVTMTKTPEALSGSLTTTLKRSDYNLKIPSVPFVAEVSETFTGSATFNAPMVKN